VDDGFAELTEAAWDDGDVDEGFTQLTVAGREEGGVAGAGLGVRKRALMRWNWGSLDVSTCPRLHLSWALASRGGCV